MIYTSKRKFAFAGVLEEIKNRKVFAIMFDNEIVGELVIKNIEEHKCATMGLAMKNTKYKDRGFQINEVSMF